MLSAAVETGTLIVKSKNSTDSRFSTLLLLNQSRTRVPFKVEFFLIQFSIPIDRGFVS